MAHGLAACRARRGHCHVEPAAATVMADASLRSPVPVIIPRSPLSLEEEAEADLAATTPAGLVSPLPLNTAQQLLSNESAARVRAERRVAELEEAVRMAEAECQQHRTQREALHAQVLTQAQPRADGQDGTADSDTSDGVRLRRAVADLQGQARGTGMGGARMALGAAG